MSIRLTTLFLISAYTVSSFCMEPSWHDRFLAAKRKHDLHHMSELLNEKSKSFQPHEKEMMFDGYSLLSCAVECGHEAFVRKLLELNANPNKASSGGTVPLIVAAQKGHTGIARLLLDHKAQKCSEALEYARYYNNHELARLLEPKDSDIDE